MKSWGTPSQTEYSNKNFSMPAVIEKSRNKTKTPTWKFIDFTLRRRPVDQNLSKALDILSVTAQVAPDLLKALAILS